MKSLSTKPKFLLCTAYQRCGSYFADALGEATLTGIPRFSMRRNFSPGLRFIKQNVPEVEILEYPTWPEYVAKLKAGWDLVGFSFYQYEIDDVEIMAAEARRQGAAEIWAGNFGALDSGVSRFADRVVTGPGENEIARVFGYGVRDDELEVAPVVGYISTTPGNIRHFAFGVLYTTRGCPYRCTFCQTPVFDDRSLHYNIDSIARVLRYYKRIGLNYVFIIDEFFGARPAFYGRLVDLLARHKFRWYCQSRTATVLRHLDDWYARGLRFIQIGLESMNRDALDALKKKQAPEEVSAFARAAASKPDLLRIAGCMIGYDNMTAEDTLREASLLKELGFDIYAVNVLTPYPQTAFWDDVKARYGITERQNRLFDSKNLVWRHPHVSAPEMEVLYKKVVDVLNRPTTAYWKNLIRFVRSGYRAGGARGVWQSVVTDAAIANRVADRKAFFFPKRRPSEAVPQPARLGFRCDGVEPGETRVSVK